MSAANTPRPGSSGHLIEAETNPRLLIVADDLTGGNACGALFAEAGQRVITITGTDADRLSDLDRLLDEFDVVVVNADSRHLPAQEAQRLYTEIIGAAGIADLVACRIDTTLRGSVGPTAAAALTARRRALAAAGGPPRRVLGLCIPAFPTAGRTTVNGHQLLQGQLLERTELSSDVRSPIRTSNLTEILAAGTELTGHLIDISTVLAGPEAIRAEILAAVAGRADVLIADALTTDHINLVGTVAAEVSRSIAEAADAETRQAAGLGPAEVLDWVTIDPGPASLALALSLLPTRTSGVVLGLSGSVTEVTRAQLAAVSEDPQVALVRTVLDEDGLPDVGGTLEQVGPAASARTIIIATVLDSGDLRELTAEESDLTTQRLAQIGSAVMSTTTITGLYTTGGDVTAAVMSELDAIGLEIDKEIIPLAVGGRLVGGRADGLPIVTKGGLIGDADAAAECLDHLHTTARVRRK